MRADFDSAIGALILFIMSAAIHEAGHCITAIFFGIPMKSLRFLSSGALMTFDFGRTTYFKEAAVHLGGSLFAISAAVLSYLTVGDAASAFIGMTAVLSAVNLIPIKGTDGSAVLKAVLMNYLLPDTAEKITMAVSWISWSILWCAVVWIEMRVGANMSLMLFVLGLFFGNIFSDKEKFA